jgi:hypothetical protein
VPTHGFFARNDHQRANPHLISEDQLTPDELERFRELESELLALFHPEDRKARRTFQFDAGPVVVICPTARTGVQGLLGAVQDPNFTRLRQYGDLDALIELYGHLRAENPVLEVFHRLTSNVVSDDFSGHVILLGGIGWNKATRRFQSAISQVRIMQTAVDDLSGGDIFRVEISFVLKHLTPRCPSIRRMRIWGMARKSLRTSATSPVMVTPSESIALLQSATASSAVECSVRCAA